jgi:hypothetical protein
MMAGSSSVMTEGIFPAGAGREGTSLMFLLGLV